MNGDQKKDSAIKTLAIIGFTALIVCGVWLAVQVVQVAPTAFTSLASLADDVYGPKETSELTVVTSKNVVNNEETFELRWTELATVGEYQFTYTCTDGVQVWNVYATGDRESITCEQPYALDGNGVASLKVVSDSQRFIDINYTLVFVPEDESKAKISDINQITVVNASIPQGGLVAGANDEEETEETETEPVVEPETDVTTQEESDMATETTPPVPAPTPEPEYVFTYELPESDPNGFVDLDVDYLGVGHLINETFIPRATIDNDAQGALRFSVKNIGTKTSEDWTYEVELPNGTTYESPRQNGLKPQETATIVLGFSVVETGFKSFSGEVNADDDLSNANNRFAWSVGVTN